MHTCAYKHAYNHANRHGYKQTCMQARKRTYMQTYIQTNKGKPPDDTGPDSRHSSECVQVSRQGQHPRRPRIGYPRGNDKRGWPGLDEGLKQGLKQSLKDGSVKYYSDSIYNKCVERFGGRSCPMTAEVAGLLATAGTQTSQGR